MSKTKRFFIGLMISLGMTFLIMGFQEIIATLASSGRMGDIYLSFLYFAIAIVLMIIGFKIRKQMLKPTPIIYYILSAIGIFLIYYFAVTFYYLLIYRPY